MQTYTDSSGFTVEVGTIVGWAEEYDFTDIGGKSYLVVKIDDLVHMTEVTDLSYNETTQGVNYHIIDQNVVLAVYKEMVSAI
jgi:hypothetical protein